MQSMACMPCDCERQPDRCCEGIGSWPEHWQGLMPPVPSTCVASAASLAYRHDGAAVPWPSYCWPPEYPRAAPAAATLSCPRAIPASTTLRMLYGGLHSELEAVGGAVRGTGWQTLVAAVSATLVRQLGLRSSSPDSAAAATAACRAG